MFTRFLFPHYFKRIGILLLIPATILGIDFLFGGYYPSWLTFRVPALFCDNDSSGASHFFDIIINNWTDELAGVLFVLGAIFTGFSKEKDEDEYIARLRMESLVWSTYVNYGLLILTILFVYGGTFLTFMMLYMFTLLLIFIIRFSYVLLKFRKSSRNEE